MKTLIVVPLACVALVAGCASSDKMRQVEPISETNQKLLRETDQRLRTLEQSVNTLDTQVAQVIADYLSHHGVVFAYTCCKDYGVNTVHFCSVRSYIFLNFFSI